MTSTPRQSSRSRLAQGWQTAASLLAIKFDANFKLELQCGQGIVAAGRVLHFGAPLGMLVFDRYEDVKGRVAEIQAAGYGFSVMDAPRVGEAFELDAYIQVLRDWEWCGLQDDRPAWLG